MCRIDYTIPYWIKLQMHSGLLCSRFVKLQGAAYLYFGVWSRFGDHVVSLHLNPCSQVILCQWTCLFPAVLRVRPRPREEFILIFVVSDKRSHNLAKVAMASACQGQGFNLVVQSVIRIVRRNRKSWLSFTTGSNLEPWAQKLWLHVAKHAT